MKKSILYALIILNFFIIPAAFAGRVDLTTYYPAPYGEYQELRSTGNSYFATTTGNVGIGTATPGAKLDVIRPGNANVHENGIRANRPDSLGCYAFMGYGQGSADAYFGSVYTGTAGYYGRLFFRQYTQGMSSRDAMMINEDGNVGIGTTSPSWPFTVQKSRSNDAVAYIRNTASDGYGPVLEGGNGTRYATQIRSYNQTPLVTVLGNGNVGIGTSTSAFPAFPDTKLTIIGTVKTNLDLSSDKDHYQLANNAGTVYARLGLKYSSANMYISTNSVSDAMVITQNGNVGIGTTSPAERLDVNGDIVARNFLYSHTGVNWMGIGANDTYSMIASNYGKDIGFGFTNIKSFGECWMQFYYALQRIKFYRAIELADGSIYGSDTRMKLDQQPLNYGLNEIMKLKPKSYMRLTVDNDMEAQKLTINPDRKKARKDMGLVAQEVYKVIPELVSKPQSEEKDIWMLNYNGIIAVLVKGIQEQQAEIQNLKSRIEKLEKR